MGVNGFSYFAGFKEISAKALAEKLQMDRNKEKLKVPTLEDFGRVKSGEEFMDLKGTGDKVLKAFEEFPQSLWVLPQVVNTFFNSKTTDIEAVGDELAVLLEVWDDEEKESCLKPLCKFLVFAWMARA